MPPADLNRRDFNRLTAAAFGGLMAGSVVGCGGGDSEPKPAPAPTGESTAAASTEVHLCRGLNACKGLGADGKNACAGQGTCASEAARHECGGNNACKGQGGCGSNPTTNDCKGQGGCHVPLMDDAWTTARELFEKKLKENGKEFGPAPAKPAA